MKAICIDDSIGTPTGNYPKFGEIVTVSQCNVYPENYDVAEYPIDKEGYLQSMKKSRFTPLSNIDEIDLVKERELVC